MQSSSLVTPDGGWCDDFSCSMSSLVTAVISSDAGVMTLYNAAIVFDLAMASDILQTIWSICWQICRLIPLCGWWRTQILMSVLPTYELRIAYALVNLVWAQEERIQTRGPCGQRRRALVPIPRTDNPACQRFVLWHILPFHTWSSYSALNWIFLQESHRFVLLFYDLFRQLLLFCLSYYCHLKFFWRIRVHL